MRIRNLFIALIAGTAMAAGLFVFSYRDAPAELQGAFVRPEPIALPEFSLLEQHGDAFTPDSFKGQWDVVFFGFTSCPDICPTTMQKLAAMRKQLAQDGSGTLPRVVLISVDPERDTPELMGQYVDYFGEGNVGVTGDIENLTRLTKALGIYFEKADLGDGNYTVNHSPAVIVVDPEGRYHSVFGGQQTSEIYAADMAVIMGRF